MKARPTFTIHTLGCKVNQYDSRHLNSRLLSYGFQSGEKDNDLVIVNTCAVTRNAIKKDKRAIAKIKKENPQARSVVMGCWPQAYPEEAKDLDAHLIWGVGRTEELAKKIAFLMEMEPTSKTEDGSLISEDRSRYFLKIQDGCEQFCSYCIIPYTRGELKSRSPAEIKQEAEKAVRQGFEEIVLTGIHLGLYGVEKKNGKKLVDLLKDLIRIDGLGRIRLSSIEINEITKELMDLVSSSDRICPHLHIPLQSGSDKILKAMNRPYNSSFFQEKVDLIRARIPDIALTTDVMVGFPGEGEKEFRETKDLIDRIRFSRLHVFPFSPHEGTPAARMEGKVTTERIKTRAEILRKKSTELEKTFYQKFNNKTVHPVVEKVEKGQIKGRTEYYFQVFFDKKRSRIVSQYNNNKDLIGRIDEVQI